jgi:hypothetical protein
MTNFTKQLSRVFGVVIVSKYDDDDSGSSQKSWSLRLVFESEPPRHPRAGIL